MSDEYPKPSVTVDILVFYYDRGEVSLPLVQRQHDPFEGRWALPGGFMEIDETLLDAARRELHEETGLTADDLERGPIFDAVNRDPRGRVISVPHATLVPRTQYNGKAGSDAAELELFSLDSLPDDLAFDHAEIIQTMRVFAAGKVEAAELATELGPRERAMVVRGLLGMTDEEADDSN